MALSALTVSLHTIVSECEADFGTGDVAEMEAYAEKIREEKLLKLAFLGAKLGPEGHPWSS